MYDGFHAGWHELHPLMPIIRMGDESPYFLEWNPDYPNETDVFPDLPWMASASPTITGLTGWDVKQGLNSQKFLDRTKALRQRGCEFLTEAFDPKVGTSQQGLGERWTIHPNTDGCKPPEPPPEPPH